MTLPCRDPKPIYTLLLHLLALRSLIREVIPSPMLVQPEEVTHNAVRRIVTAGVVYLGTQLRSRVVCAGYKALVWDFLVRW